MAHNLGPGSNWVSGVIARQLGPVSNGQVWNGHVDHLKELVSDRTSPTSNSEFNIDVPFTATFDHPHPEEPDNSPSNDDSSLSEAGEHVDSPSTHDTTSLSSSSAYQTLIRLDSASHPHDLVTHGLVEGGV